MKDRSSSSTVREDTGRRSAGRRWPWPSDKARTDRFVLMGIRNTHHLGRIGEWAEMCAEAGFVSMHFSNGTNRPPIVAPFGGAAPRMGTAPYTAAFPRRNAPPILVDMASSVVAMNKVRVALNRGDRMPEGVIIDSEGHPTTDPAVLYEPPTGALLPVGGHKGYATWRRGGDVRRRTHRRWRDARGTGRGRRHPQRTLVGDLRSGTHGRPRLLRRRDRGALRIPDVDYPRPPA